MHSRCRWKGRKVDVFFYSNLPPGGGKGVFSGKPDLDQLSLDFMSLSMCTSHELKWQTGGR